MMFHLFLRGEVMVVGRQSTQKPTDLSEKLPPSLVSKKEFSVEEVEYLSAQRSLRALGIANSSEISWHFFRNRYPNLKATIKQLVVDEKIIPVDITDGPVGKGERYIHSKDIALLDELETDKWEPRVSLLSPFDNLFCDRARTKLLFNFDYTIEIYTPPKQTQVRLLRPPDTVRRQIHRAFGSPHGPEKRETDHQGSLR